MNNTIIIAMIVLIAALAGFSFVLPYTTQETITIKITDKERIIQRSGDSVSSKYLIFTEYETFENTDSFAIFKFNSSDIQGRLQIGNEYRVTVYGFRIPFLSSYRNIKSIN